MTEDATLSQRLKDTFLTCNICWERLQCPKSLPCLHTFCEACLEQYAKKASAKCKGPEKVFPCPLCRRLIAIPAGGIGSFRNNFVLTSLKDELYAISGSIVKPDEATAGDEENIKEACSGCCGSGTPGQQVVVATEFCEECEDFLCDLCVKAHKRYKMTRTHQLISLKEQRDEIRNKTETRRPPPLPPILTDQEGGNTGQADCATDPTDKLKTRKSSKQDDGKEEWFIQLPGAHGQRGSLASNDELSRFEWYFNNLSGQDSETLLNREDKEGCFVVRDSRQQGKYSLSLFTKTTENKKIWHYHIEQNDRQEYFLSDAHPFPTIPEVICFHQRHPAGLASRLTSPPTHRSVEHT